MLVQAYLDVGLAVVLDLVLKTHHKEKFCKERQIGQKESHPVIIQGNLEYRECKMLLVERRTMDTVELLPQERLLQEQFQRQMK